MNRRTFHTLALGTGGQFLVDRRGQQEFLICHPNAADDGTAQPGGVVEGGKPQTLRSPWQGEDCVVRLLHE